MNVDDIYGIIIPLMYIDLTLEVIKRDSVLLDILCCCCTVQNSVWISEIIIEQVRDHRNIDCLRN